MGVAASDPVAGSNPSPGTKNSIGPAGLGPVKSFVNGRLNLHGEGCMSCGF